MIYKLQFLTCLKAVTSFCFCSCCTCIVCFYLVVCYYTLRLKVMFVCTVYNWHTYNVEITNIFVVAHICITQATSYHRTTF